MDQNLLISIFWIVVFVFIYKKIKNNKRTGHKHFKSKKQSTKRREVKVQNAITNNYTNLLLETLPSYKETHGRRCYMEEMYPYERSVANHLSRHLDPKSYYIFNNITIPSSATITSQIDHLIVSRFGIFVIENKDYNGWIFGQKNHKKWTKVVKGGKKYHFQNPLHQNFAHVTALRENLPFLKKQPLSVVVFSENSEFKTVMAPNVLHGEDLIVYIESKTQILLQEGELLMAVGKLSMLCQSCTVSDKQHTKNLEYAHLKNRVSPIPLFSQTGVNS